MSPDKKEERLIGGLIRFLFRSYLVFACGIKSSFAFPHVNFLVAI